MLCWIARESFAQFLIVPVITNFTMVGTERVCLFFIFTSAKVSSATWFCVVSASNRAPSNGPNSIQKINNILFCRDLISKFGTLDRFTSFILVICLDEMNGTGET